MFVVGGECLLRGKGGNVLGLIFVVKLHCCFELDILFLEHYFLYFQGFSKFLILFDGVSSAEAGSALSLLLLLPLLDILLVFQRFLKIAF